MLAYFSYHLVFGKNLAKINWCNSAVFQMLFSRVIYCYLLTVNKILESGLPDKKKNNYMKNEKHVTKILIWLWLWKIQVMFNCVTFQVFS